MQGFEKRYYPVVLSHGNTFLLPNPLKGELSEFIHQRNRFYSHTTKFYLVNNYILPLGG